MAGMVRRGTPRPLAKPCGPHLPPRTTSSSAEACGDVTVPGVTTAPTDRLVALPEVAPSWQVTHASGTDPEHVAVHLRNLELGTSMFLVATATADGLHLDPDTNRWGGVNEHLRLRAQLAVAVTALLKNPALVADLFQEQSLASAKRTAAADDGSHERAFLEQIRDQQALLTSVYRLPDVTHRQVALALIRARFSGTAEELHAAVAHATR